jgi:hypothetical protein
MTPLRQSRVARAQRLLCMLTAGFLLSGCGEVARLLAPGRDESAPAQVAIRTSIAAQVGQANDVVVLRVRASYLRADGSRVAMGQQTLTLTAAQLQTVPIPVDVAPCLADPAREGTTDGGCPAVLELALVVNDVVVDQQVIGPLRLTPGATTSVADPVTLFEISSLLLGRRDGVALEPEPGITAGGSLALTAALRDSRGQAVTDRPISWSSASPAVATVDATGLVRAVAPGTARISATAGSLTASQVVRVTRPAVELVIAAGAGSGRGTVRSTPAGIDCTLRDGTATGSCRSPFAADAMVTLVASADSGNRLDGWSDACSVTTASCTIQMTTALRASARFTALRRVRVTAPGGDGRGTVTSDPAGISCRVDGAVLSGSCEMDVPQGTTVQLRADASVASTSTPASSFGGWGGACTGALPGCSVVVASTEQVVRPTFFGARTLTVTLGGTGSGRVSGDGIDCSGLTTTCRVSVAHGTTVTVTATANSDATFEGWNGCPGAPTSSCTLTLTANSTLSASFAQRPVTLTMSLTGSGGGSLLVDGRARCTLAVGQRATSCIIDVARGAVLTISSVADASSRLVALRDVCTGLTSCTVTMTGPKTVSAEFSRDLVPVRIVVQGTGAGSVQLVGTTTCTRIKGQAPSVCETLVPADDARTLRAVADDGSEFKGFSAPCGSAPSCSFVPGEPRTIVATFDEQLVTVDLAPVLGATGRGIVVSTIGPTINCNYAVGGATTGLCTMTAPAGTLVVLRATPDVVFGSLFVGWTGACEGVTTATCTFVLRPTTPTTMGARFMARP